jgi:cell wall-associated NlpC family hydrolase
MRFNRSTAAVVLVAASIPALAAAPWSSTPSCDDVGREALYTLSLPGGDWDGRFAEPALDAAILRDAARADEASPRAAASAQLAKFAMTLRNIRYRSGGRSPKTGFDCSGFVQYVFAQSLGVELPDTSNTQFQDGTGVTRNELQTGDLVFFHTRGRSVSHVGIYLDHGRFIHSPSPGKRVRIDDLSDSYWAGRYAGARRPNALILSS